jgi:Domain of unknown function (DUF4417)
MPDDISGTRSNEHWSTQPAKMDTLNTRLIFDSVGAYDIPVLAPSAFVPKTLGAWHDPVQRRAAAADGGALHFFLDDYRFEKVWSRPESTYERVAEVGAALSPDFSMWRDMPKAMQIWQVYRSRWCAAFWQHLGVEVVPTVTWGGTETFDFTFDGLPRCATLALSMVGVRKDGKQKFITGLNELVSRLDPAMLLCYGQLRGVEPGCPVTVYPAHWDSRR